MTRDLRGVFAAMPTPFTAELAPDLPAVAMLLDDLVAQGCHGALLCGTTGEGPSLAVAERRAVIEAATVWRAATGRADFVLIGGTGCANAPETITLSRAALGAGCDAVLVLPPFYFKQVSVVGLARYYAEVFEALPEDARVLVYHIPSLTGVPISAELIAALRAAYGPMLAGLKDSGADLDDTRGLLARFPEITLLTGTDNHLLPALEAGAAGCITALASACGSVLRAAYDAHAAGRATAADQARLEALRAAGYGFPPVPAVKCLLAARRGLPRWPVRPPLVPLALAEDEALAQAIAVALGESEDRAAPPAQPAG